MSDKPRTRSGRKIFIVHASAIVFGLVVAACSFDIKEARNLAVEGDEFNDELAREYRNIALFEADEMYDWPDAALFSRKAILASTGQSPAPEDIRDWNISKKSEPAFAEARYLLLEKLEAGFGDQMPVQAARAQVSFDCWMEQEEEGWQAEHIAKCRQEFENAVNVWVKFRQATNTLDPNIFSPTIIADIAPVTDKSEFSCLSGEPTSYPPSHDYLIQFQHNSAQINDAAETVLSASAIQASGVETIEVFIEGHADLSGAAGYNIDLSLRRALAVWRRMIALGVSPEKMWIGPRGELKPISNAADGTQNSLDRRVAMILTGKPGGELVEASECVDQQLLSQGLAEAPDLPEEPNK